MSEHINTLFILRKTRFPLEATVTEIQLIGKYYEGKGKWKGGGGKGGKIGISMALVKSSVFNNSPTN